MRHLFSPALLVIALGLAGCGYIPGRPDPIRYVTSPADAFNCRRLGNVGLARTDSQGYTGLEFLVPFIPSLEERGSVARGVSGREIVGPTFAPRLNVMRDAALGLGATDLLLARRIYNDWSYVEGIAYRCPR